jgi:DinB superfamily
MLDTAIQVNLFLMQYCRNLVADIADDRLAEQPVPGVNHPAWVLGHLALTADRGLALLDAIPIFPTAWAPLFDRGSTPSNSRSAYGSKDELLGYVERGYEQLRHTAASATGDQLARPTPMARAKETLPTINEVIAFIMTGHMGGHLGQLSAWRRMIGLPPLF